MLLIPPPKRKSARKPKRGATTPAAPALTLVSATFDPDGPEVYLTFDREIDISGLVVGQFIVADGPDGNSLVGFESPILIGPTEVQVLMTFVAPTSGPDTLLTAGPGSGIVAVDDGGTWAGVVDLVLPFP